jgi:hypothetical protein
MVLPLCLPGCSASFTPPRPRVLILARKCTTFQRRGSSSRQSITANPALFSIPPPSSHHLHMSRTLAHGEPKTCIYHQTLINVQSSSGCDEDRACRERLISNTININRIHRIRPSVLEINNRYFLPLKGSMLFPPSGYYIDKIYIPTLLRQSLQ